MTGHTVKSYDRELEALGRAIAEMGDRVSQIVVAAVDSMISGDTAQAHEVVAAGRRLDEQRRQIEYNAFLTIARRAPVAVDLREVVAAIRISGDLGRIASHAVSIANRAIKTGAATRIPRASLGVEAYDRAGRRTARRVLARLRKP